MRLYFADFQSPDNFKETWAELETPFAMCDKLKFNLVGFCNGLFCIHYEPLDVISWNSWIKNHNKLPFCQTLDDLLLWHYKYFQMVLGMTMLLMITRNRDHDSDFSILAIDLRSEPYQLFPQLKAVLACYLYML
ncbi:hypothetical protein ACH5RR_007032 [Cinchona calisaya]|uniref:Uncharacterized protein n=1 Tax=Cinchona calisaya TaxID=153742 RepID=A0ABD3AR17_9GENT